MPFW